MARRREKESLGTAKIQDIRSFWETHPLCASAIPHPLGTAEYFKYYDGLREVNESIEFSRQLHEYESFSDRKVLDVGAGNGYVLSRYARKGAEVWGVDITKTGIDLCRKRFKLLGLRGEFLVANAEALPFESNSFDCVCSMGVLHHTPHTAVAVDEMFRVLKSGGQLIVMVYHRNSALYRIKLPAMSLATGKTLQQLVNEVDGTGNPKGSVFSKEELHRLLRQFKELDVFPGVLQGWMLFPRGMRLFPNRWLQKCERYGGWFLYAKGKKP